MSMPNWYYDKSDLRNTPSSQDSIDHETEQRYRREGARFIINVGTTMGLRFDTMATGVVYFHRFYMFHSFRTFPRYVTACCCLFLAGKVEETPKKCKDIIKTAQSLLSDKWDKYFSQYGEDPKEEVMTLERILLQTIKFDLQVDHPYGYLLKYAKALRGDKTKVQKLVQMAWTFVNDSLCTTLCLQWEPEIIAIALMYLASKLSKFEVLDWAGRTSKHNRWWDMFVEDMTVDLLEDICHQVLDLYSTPVPTTPIDSPPASPPLTAKGRLGTPLPGGKGSSPTKMEVAQTPVTPVNVPPTAVVPPAAVPIAVPLPPSAPLPPAQTASRAAPVATPAIAVGLPIPCLEEGVVKLPIPPPPPAKTHLSEPLVKASVPPTLVSPIQSIAPNKFNFPPSGGKPPITKPPQLPPKEEQYPYGGPPPLPPPPGPPFQQPVFRDSPKELYGTGASYRQPSQYYPGSEPPPSSQYYASPEDKPYYGPSAAAASGSYMTGPPVRPYPDVYGSAAPAQPSAPLGMPGHGPPSHVPPPGHMPSTHPPPPPAGLGPPVHPPPGHGLPSSHGPPARVHPLGPYEDKPRPYLGASPFHPGPPRQPPGSADGQYHYSHEPAATGCATGIPTVRITGRY